MTIQEQVENVLKDYLIGYGDYRESIKELLKEAVLKAKKWRETELKKEVNEQLQTLKEQFKAKEITYNNQLKVIVEDVKTDIFDDDKTKSSDYAARVANANDYLRMEGSDITDDQAYLILKDFIDDLDQMQLFKRVIESKGVEFVDSSGNANFPKTFGKLNEHLTILNTFNEFESISESYFLNSTAESGETYQFFNTSYSVPTRSYSQVKDVPLLIALSEELDEYILKRDTPSEQARV